MKKILFLTVVTVLLLSLFTFAQASTNYANVTLPTFNVTFNGTKIDNSYRQYPLITYKNITYFPMTYNDCRYLGLETTWDNKEGLGVSKKDISCGYRNDNSKNKNKSSYTATIPSFNIKINGKLINNKTEQYPFLLFRDVTYFPMTWKYCVNEYGWKYNFSTKDGLKIESTNKKVNTVFDADNVQININGQNVVAATDKSLYYVAPNNYVCGINYSNINNVNKIHFLPSPFRLPSEGEDNACAIPKFYIEDGKVCFSYTAFGATAYMQYNYSIDDNFKGNEIPNLSNIDYNTNDFKIHIDTTSGKSNNMTISINNGEFKQFGNKNYRYGVLLAEYYDAFPPKTSPIYYKDNYIYVSAIDSVNDETISKICRVNVGTGETEIITKDKVLGEFTLFGNYIYYSDKVYTPRQINTNTLEDTLTNKKMSNNLIILNNKMYYIDIEYKDIYDFATNKAINSLGKLSNYYQFDDYLICTYIEERDNPYRLIVLDKNGNKIFQSSDVATFCYIKNDTLYYYEQNSEMVYSVKLK